MDRLRLHWKSREYKVWRFIGLLIIIGFLFGRFYIWTAIEQSNAQTASGHFDAIVQNDVTNLRSRFEIYADTLYSGRALFIASDSVTREDWMKFVDAQNIGQRYPGVNSVGYISVIDRAQAADLTGKLNSARLPSDPKKFSIYPATTNRRLAVVTYNAPEAADQSVLGYDLFSNPARTQTLDIARDTGTPQATVPLTLANEKANQKTSLLVAMPVYNGSGRLTTVTQRRAALKGYVILTLHTQAMLDSIVGTTYKNFAVKVSANGQKLYEKGTAPTNPGLHKTVDINVAGKVWRLNFSASSDFGLGHFSTFAPPIFFWTSVPLAIVLFLVLYLATNLRTQSVTRNREPEEHSTKR